MRHQRAPQAAPASPEQPHGGGDIAHGLADLGLAESPFLTVAEAARFLRFEGRNPEKAMREFATAYGIPAKRRGRVLLFERRVLLEIALRSA